MPSSTEVASATPTMAEIKGKLEAVVNNRAAFVRSKDIAPLFDRVVEHIREAEKSRPKSESASESGGPTDLTVVDECVYLISLAFMATGSQDAPAVYAQILTVERLLDHLKEVSFFSSRDLELVEQRLELVQSILDSTGPNYDGALIRLLDRRVRSCWSLIEELRNFLKNLTPDLAVHYDRLVEILRGLSACNTRQNFPASEVQAYIDEIEQIATTVEEEGISIDSSHDACLAGEGICEPLRVSQVEEETPSGPDHVRQMLKRCIFAAHLIIEKKGKIDPAFESLHRSLIRTRNQLEKMIATLSWSVRQTDLFPLFEILVAADRSRQDGRFVTDAGQPADLYTHRTLLYLTRKGYALIYQILVTSEPVSEPLVPIFNQLRTLKVCLDELMSDGEVSDAKELYPYWLKLKSIDRLRVDGDFVVNHEIPEGQGQVRRLYEECETIIRNLRRG